MDAVSVLFIVGLAILLAWALAVAITRGRVIERLRDATGAGDADDVERRVRGALESADAARWDAEQVIHDTGYLSELLTAGVVRLRDDLTVESANSAAHVMLERRPGRWSVAPPWRPSSTPESRQWPGLPWSSGRQAAS
jgi:hypothetical protein